VGFWRRVKDRFRREPKPAPEQLADLFRYKYAQFRELLDSNTELALIISDMAEKLRGTDLFDMSYVRSRAALGMSHAARMVRSLNALSRDGYPGLERALARIGENIARELEARSGPEPMAELVLELSRVDRTVAPWVGGKSANLGEVRNRVGLRVPDGFAVTTTAFELFMNQGDLRDAIRKLKAEADLTSPDQVREVCEAIQHRILTTPVPRDLEAALTQAFDALQGRVAGRGASSGGLRIAMRSSAVGEDSELSYAGQYVSQLNVGRDRLAHTYRIIAASLYTPRAVSYRFHMGVRDEDVAMGVACLEMVESVAAGVAYSMDPVLRRWDRVVITGVWGLGPYAVDGKVTPDRFAVGKGEPWDVLERHVAGKPVRLVMREDGRLEPEPVPEEDRGRPCLEEAHLRELARAVVHLERHFGCPQDVEWAVDGTGNLFILQSRPLQGSEGSMGKAHGELKTPVFTEAGGSQGAPLRAVAREEAAPPPRPGNSKAEAAQEPLVTGGETAVAGVACGPVHPVRRDEDLEDFPRGAVLVAHHSSPSYVLVMDRAAAIVTEAGSATGHMASVAREFSIPTLVGVEGAMEILAPGRLVTVDAGGRSIYAGCRRDLILRQGERRPILLGTPVHETLRRVASWIVPLTLLDPKSPDFQPGNCRTLHDVMRYAHEMSYHEMFRLSDGVSGGQGWAVKLEAELPIDLHLLDLGGGLDPRAAGRGRVTLGDVRSVPLLALLEGMTHEAFRGAGPKPVNLRGFLSVLSEQMLSPPRLGAERFGDRSYAVISDKYLNFSSRVGYHYSIVDSYCGQTQNKNYITFSFMGGAADEVRRNRRVRAIGRILEALDFRVDVVGDRMTARYQKYPCDKVRERLDRVGRLLQYTRQMDMFMNSEESVEEAARRFLEERYGLDE